MEKTYHLDLKTLLEFMRSKSAILRTTLTIPKQRNACQGVLYLKKDGSAHGFIFTQEGLLLFSGADAHTALSTSTEWLVRLDTEQVVEAELLALARRYGLALGNSPNHAVGSSPPFVNLPSGSPPNHAVGRAPRPKNPLDQTILQRFSARQSLTLRTVLAMVNGTRSVEQIKAQLNLSPELVEEALEVLRNIDIIE